jgi:hypothetical protein
MPQSRKLRVVDTHTGENGHLMAMIAVRQRGRRLALPGRTALLSGLKPLRSLYFADGCFAAGRLNFRLTSSDTRDLNPLDGHANGTNPPSPLMQDQPWSRATPYPDTFKRNPRPGASPGPVLVCSL